MNTSSFSFRRFGAVSGPHGPTKQGPSATSTGGADSSGLFLMLVGRYLQHWAWTVFWEPLCMCMYVCIYMYMYIYIYDVYIYMMYIYIYMMYIYI